MAQHNHDVVSLVLLLKEPRLLSLEDVAFAADMAFGPIEPDVIPVANKPMFGVQMPGLMLGVIAVARPYFADLAAASEAIASFPTRQAVAEHTAWISIDIMKTTEDDETAMDAVGALAAEFLDEDVVAVLATPSGEVTAYDPCFADLIRSGNVQEIFRLGPPMPVAGTSPDDAELTAATSEAIRRWPEFLDAFQRRRKGQGFGVKKRFHEGDIAEHMWVEVLRVDGSTLEGRLSNDPRSLTNVTLGSPVVLQASEIEDWLFTDGTNVVGGFQLPILERRQRH